MNAFSDILGYLLQTAISLYLLAMLLRLVLQLVRADFYNPISQFLVKITNPLVLPLRRVLPNVARLDLASLSLALLLQISAIASILLLNSLPLPNPFVLIVWGFIGLLSLLVNIYFFALLAVIILSWIAPSSNSPALLLLHQITEPVMAPFRKMLPPMGGMDFSPIIVFILINVIQIALRHMAVGAGLHPALVIGL